MKRADFVLVHFLGAMTGAIVNVLFTALHLWRLRRVEAELRELRQ